MCMKQNLYNAPKIGFGQSSLGEFISVLHNYHYVLSPLFWECPHLHLSFGTRELTNNTPTSKYATKYPPFGERGGLGPHYVRKHLPPLGGGGEEDWSLI